MRASYLHRMFKRGISVLNSAAEAVAEFETLPIEITWPPRIGVDPRTIVVRGYFDENPALHTIASTGIKASLNGILYVRETQVDDDLRRSIHDQSIAVGFAFKVRGREYRCVKADFARGEYAFTLSDLNEADDG